MRPRPPERLLGGDGATTDQPVEPSHELEAWARSTFIDEGAPFLNEEHLHLREARIGFMWCAEPNGRHGQPIAGLTELAQFMGNRWARARFLQQLSGWFGDVPHFLVTLDANYAAECSDAAFCALVDHELLHCGQERDAFGAPKFTKDGRPKFALRGHDVEEFVSIVARYGAGSAAGKTVALVEAASRPALICAADITSLCGTCRP